MNRILRVAMSAVIFCVFLSGIVRAESVSGPNNGILTVKAVSLEQTGKIPAEADQNDTLFLAIGDDDAGASIFMDFNLDDVAYPVTPLAQLQIKDLVNLRQENRGKALGALHVLAQSLPGGSKKVVGSTVVRPAGIPFSYTIDVTDAINEVLSRSPGQRKVRLEFCLAGDPNFARVYALPVGEGKTASSLDIFSPVGWKNDLKERLVPITSGDIVYRETCLPLTADANSEITLRLLYPVKKVIEVINNADGKSLQEGRDWVLRDGKVVLPVGSQAPVQLESEFFTTMRKDKEGNLQPVRSSIRLEEGIWYHTRQIDISYEPAVRDWSFPPAVSSLDKLPRLKGLLKSKSDVKYVLFGDSISFGGNASKVTGTRPYQPCYGELVAWELERHYGSKVMFMNHSRGGATSSYAIQQAGSLVGSIKPDLVIVAFGMNDRADARREVFVENMENTIKTIRAMSPETEFVIVTPMMNNPKQPTGSGPIFDIHDKILKLSGQGIAFVDVTNVHKELLERKDYLDLSGNGANHPNDFLHRIYAQLICQLLIQ